MLIRGHYHLYFDYESDYVRATVPVLFEKVDFHLRYIFRFNLDSLSLLKKNWGGGGGGDGTQPILSVSKYSVFSLLRPFHRPSGFRRIRTCYNKQQTNE